METVFDAIARAHSHLARKRVLGDITVLSRDARDLLDVTWRDLRERAKQACSDRDWNTAIGNHPYECLGTALGLGVLAGLLMARRT